MTLSNKIIFIAPLTIILASIQIIQTPGHQSDIFMWMMMASIFLQVTLAFYIPVLISDLINLISMGYDLLHGFDIDYSISTLTKFLSPLFMMGLGRTML